MKLYRLIESVIKKIYKIPNYTKNEKLKKTFISAIYNTSTHQDVSPYAILGERISYSIRRNTYYRSDNKFQQYSILE